MNTTDQQRTAQIQHYLNRKLTGKDRSKWAQSRPDDGKNYRIDLNGQFEDPNTERVFRNTLFKERFGHLSNYKELTKLSAAERDNIYGEDLQRVDSQAMPWVKPEKGPIGSHRARVLSQQELEFYEALKKEEEEAREAGIPILSDAFDPSYQSSSSHWVKYIKASYNPDLGKTNREAQNKKGNEIFNQTLKSWSDARYLNNPQQLEADIDQAKYLFEQLSPHYQEFLNAEGDGGAYLRSEDFNWDEIAPHMARLIAAGQYEEAQKYANDYTRKKMAERQPWMSKAVNWLVRFGASVAINTADIAGLLVGATQMPYAVIKAIINKESFGDILLTGVNTLFVDNTLSAWLHGLQENLSESMTIYTDSGSMWIDPESAGFMASMFIPSAAIGKVGKAATLAGKEGKALKAAKTINKLNGYDRRFAKAGENLDKTLKAGNGQSRYLKQLGMEAEQKALKEGKSVAKAREAARAAQQEHLADMYQKGAINRTQIRVASYAEAHWEAYDAQQTAIEKFDNAWDKRAEELLDQAMSSEHAAEWENISYDLSTADKFEQEAYDNGEFEALVERYRRQYSDIPIGNIRAAAAQTIKETAIAKAKVAEYMEGERDEFEKRKKRNAQGAGLMTFGLEYGLLRLTEGLGGWTTRLAPYKNVSNVARAEREGIGNKIKESFGTVSSYNSATANMGSRLIFDEAGRAVRRVSPLSITQAAGKIAGEPLIENVQEIGQELIQSGTEGTAAYNAEEFVMSHLAGPGREVTDAAYQAQVASFFLHAGYERSVNDFKNIIRSTTVQTLVGTPSVLKYYLNFHKETDSKGKKHTEVDRLYRGTYENKFEFALRWIEKWAPINSPLLQGINQVASTNTDVRTFINTYNKFLDESLRYSGYNASGLNYAARAFDAASRDSEVDYDHSKFAAQAAEAIFLAHMGNTNQQARMIFYRNLADVNTQREGESQEDFENRRKTTLEQLRSEAGYNSLKNASDEELIKFAEQEGKNMISLVKQMYEGIDQLYEQYDGNLTWEQLYATLYSRSLKEYSTEKLKDIEDVYKGVIDKITNTEIKEEDQEKDENGNPIKIYNERELLLLDPETRKAFIDHSKGKQKEIADNLVKQLKTINIEDKLGRDVDKDLTRADIEARLIRTAVKDITRLSEDPKAFLRGLQDKKVRAFINTVINTVDEIIHDTSLDEVEKRNKISDALQGLKNLDALNWYVASEAIGLLDRRAAEVLQADKNNFDILPKLIADLTENLAKDDPMLEKWQELEDKIQKSHISFADAEIRDQLNSKTEHTVIDPMTGEEITTTEITPDQTLLDLFDKILDRLEEIKKAAPTTNIEENAKPVSDNEGSEGTPHENKRKENTEEAYQEQQKATIEKTKNDLRSRLELLISQLQLENSEELKAQIEEILSGEFESITDIQIALIKAASDKKNKKNRRLQHVLKALVTSLKDYTPESTTDIARVATQRLSLADPSFFLNREQGNFAKFFKDYHIVELLRSGKIKVGTPVYVLWDSEFVRTTKDMFKANTGTDATLKHVGLVAVVEGSIDGYPSITVGGKTYTRIGLFRAYGEGKHNSRDVVANMISKAIGSNFDGNSEIPGDIDDKIITDKNGKPISFKITAFNESSLVPTPGKSKGIKTLVEERQYSVDNEVDRNDPVGRAERAKQWFLTHLKIVSNDKGKKLPAIFVERHNDAGGVTIPIQVKNVTETPWQDTTVGEALLGRNIGLLGTENGNPVFNRVAKILRDFMVDVTVKKATDKFLKGLKEVEKLRNKKTKNSQAKAQLKFNELIAELNKDCNDVLNNTNKPSLANRLALSKDIQYYVNYVTEVDEEGTTRNYFVLGVKSTQSSYSDEANIEFMRYEAPASNGTVEAITNDKIIEGLRTLIFDKNDEVRKSPGTSYELVKWQLNYNDVIYGAGKATELISELYDMGAFEAETETLIVEQLETDITPNDESLIEEPPKPIKHEGDPDMTAPAAQDNSNKPNQAKERVDLLQLNVVTDHIWSEGVEEAAKHFTYGRENVTLGNIPIRFIGLTDYNDMTIIVDDALNTPETRIGIIEELRKLGFPNAEIFDLKSASEYNLGEKSKESAETIENKTEGKNTTEPINAMDECEARLRAQAPKERSEEEREEYSLKHIKEDFMDNWQMDLFDAGLWDGEDNSLQEIIEKIKKKYGSYRAALSAMRQTCHSPEEFESLVSCCL